MKAFKASKIQKYPAICKHITNHLKKQECLKQELLKLKHEKETLDNYLLDRFQGNQSTVNLWKQQILSLQDDTLPPHVDLIFYVGPGGSGKTITINKIKNILGPNMSTCLGQNCVTPISYKRNPYLGRLPNCEFKEMLKKGYIFYCCYDFVNPSMYTNKTIEYKKYAGLIAQALSFNKGPKRIMIVLELISEPPPFEEIHSLLKGSYSKEHYSITTYRFSEIPPEKINSKQCFKLN